jgi:hypothetical protein
MIWGYNALYVLKCEACHFGLSAFVGWLAYWSTSTIFSLTGLKGILPERRTYILLLLVALSFAVLAHIVEDYTLDWFYTGRERTRQMLNDD